MYNNKEVLSYESTKVLRSVLPEVVVLPEVMILSYFRTSEVRKYESTFEGTFVLSYNVSCTSGSTSVSSLPEVLLPEVIPYSTPGSNSVQHSRKYYFRTFVPSYEGTT